MSLIHQHASTKTTMKPGKDNLFLLIVLGGCVLLFVLMVILILVLV